MVDLIDTIVFAVRLKDMFALMNSSSGGAFTALSDYFLENGNAVVAAIYNYEKHTAEFQMILDKEHRENAKGSKYMQSKSGDIYQQAYYWLMQNPKKELLFVGMGCQADGFRKFSELRGFRDQVYVVDIICHGSPSPKLWKDYAKSIEKDGKVTYLTFKDKRNGWLYPTAYMIQDGKEKSISDYVSIFYNKCALRPSCYECPYATTERKVDITIGDYWGIDKVMPDFYSPEGNSLVLVHTEKGQELFEKIKDNVEWRESNITDCLQPNLIKPTEKSPKREEFWRDYLEKGISFVVKKYTGTSFMSKIKRKVRNIFGGGYTYSTYSSLWRAAVC